VLKRPAGVFPKVFRMMDNQTKDFYVNKRSEEMAEELRPGRVAFGDRWVRSRPLSVPGHETQVALQGKIDTALSFDDGTYGIIDLKTRSPKAGHVPFYGRQLHGYALAAENPAEGALDLSPVSQLGLLCVEPVAMIGVGDTVAYKGATLPRDRARRRGPPAESSIGRQPGLLFSTGLARVIFVIGGSKGGPARPRGYLWQ
jgi:hypothetical protein